MINNKTEFGGITVPGLIIGATALGCYLSRKSSLLQKIVAIAGTIATVAVVAKNYRSPNPISKPIVSISSEQSKIEDQRRLQGLKNHLPNEEAQSIHNYIKANIQNWKQDNRFIFIHASDNAGLSRSIQYDPKTQSVFVHLNRKKRGDKIIGEGAEKIAKLTIQYETGQVFARVIFRQCFPRETQELQKEIELLDRLNNLPGLIQTIAIDKYPSSTSKYPDNKAFKIAIIQEKMDSSLFDFITRKNNLTGIQTKDIMRDVLTGLESTHNQNIALMDFHAGNILVSIDPQSRKARAKIIDFGSAITNPTQKNKNYEVLRAGEILESLLPLCLDTPDSLNCFVNRLTAKKITSAAEAIQELDRIEIKDMTRA